MIAYSVARFSYFSRSAFEVQSVTSCSQSSVDLTAISTEAADLVKIQHGALTN